MRWTPFKVGERVHFAAGREVISNQRTWITLGTVISCTADITTVKLDVDGGVYKLPTSKLVLAGPEFYNDCVKEIPK